MRSRSGRDRRPRYRLRSVGVQMQASSVAQPRRHGLAARDQLEAGRKVADAPRAHDGHPAVLERLAQRFEDVLLEFRQLVEEEHAAVRERHFARVRGLPPPTSPETEIV